MSEFKKYLVSYRHDGAQWNVELQATSFEDAERRLSQLTFGRVDGELIASVPSSFGPLAMFAARVRNLLSGANR